MGIYKVKQVSFVLEIEFSVYLEVSTEKPGGRRKKEGKERRKNYSKEC